MKVFFWFRRDLRLQDNAALYEALSRHQDVQPVFLFDRHILDLLEDRDDARVTFIYKKLEALQAQLKPLGVSLWVHYGTPEDFWRNLANTYTGLKVYAGKDFEPGYPQQRDKAVSGILRAVSGELILVQDHILVAPDEILKPDGHPYTVYTPFSRRWLELVNENRLQERPSQNLLHHLAKTPDVPSWPTLEQMGFVASSVSFPSDHVDDEVLIRYEKWRNFPALENGTSRLGVHLRFGTISVRWLARRARALSFTFLKELCWREFFIHILHHFPHTAEKAFRPEFDRVPWRQNPGDFERWCQGQTGYPLVDAGMRQLNATGFMHNRVRMVTASFLTKHLLIDWRWGERYFARKLLDFELASNVGNWQWAAGTGCDAAPYFRIFNPALQQQKFDPEGHYINRWVPELRRGGYPLPMVTHEEARQRALHIFQKALKERLFL